ncbi:MAG: hypothetical protein ACK559_24850, partial [bacterium]
MFGANSSFSEIFENLDYFTAYHTGESLAESLLVPNFESLPHGIEQTSFLKLCANVQTEASFRAAINDLSVEFEKALI